MADRRLTDQLCRAQQKHRAGHLVEAIAGYRRILDRYPRVPEILVLAATALCELGRLRAAESLARRAVAARDDGPGRLTLGRILLAQARPVDAREELRAASDDPRVAADALFLLGEACRATADPKAATEAYERTIAVNPTNAAAWLALGRLYVRAGRDGPAEKALARARVLRPEDPEILAQIGLGSLAAGRYAEADRVASEAEALSPRAPAVLAFLGRLRKAQGRLDSAIAAWESFTQARPEDPVGWGGLAAARQAAGQLGDAGRAYQRGLALAPQDPALLAGRAEWLEWQGAYEEGLGTLTNAPDETGILLVRARLLRRLGRAEEARRILSEAIAREPVDATLMRQLRFSMGDVADVLGDYDLAFNSWAEGNRLTPARWNAGAERAWQARLDVLAPRPGSGERGREMIFIIGLPRSGTTLVEQILAAHPAVNAGGESLALGALAYEAARNGRPLSSGTLGELGRRYLTCWPREARVQGRVTDKMPINFRYLGVLQAALPGAQIVHCRRDARDVALSCFATDFLDPALGFATRLDWLADYIRFYEELVAHWRERLPTPMLEVDYEALVQDPQALTRRLLTGLDLPWNDACLAFHRQDRVAATASHAQVREPIYTRSVGRWRKYRDYLMPLGDLLDRI